MATCKECVHYVICQNEAFKEARFSVKAETVIVTIKDRIACKFFQNKADFVEVKHGEWLPDYETFVDEWERESEPVQTGWVCSLCGRQEWNKEPYCHCGADMRKGENNGK